VFVELTNFSMRNLLVGPDGTRLKPRQCRLLVIVSTESGNDDQMMGYYTSQLDTREKDVAFSARSSMQLPLRHDGDGVAIALPSAALEKHHCRVEFRLVSLLDEKLSLARGTSIAVEWHNVCQQHAVHEAELLDRDLERVARVRFRLLLVSCNDGGGGGGWLPLLAAQVPKGTYGARGSEGSMPTASSPLPQVTPFTGHDMSINRNRTYWTQRRSLPVWGHRGSGSSKASLVKETQLHHTHIQVCRGCAQPCANRRTRSQPLLLGCPPVLAGEHGALVHHGGQPGCRM
jgi:hypothetical protein